MGVARDLPRNARGEIGLRRVVDGWRIAATILDAGARPARFGKPGGDLMDSLFDPVAGCGLERAPRPIEPGRLGDDIVGRAGLKARARDDAGIERIDIARRDGLQGGHDLRAYDDRVDALMRQRAVPALAFDRDRDLIGRRHQRALSETEGANWRAGP